MLVEANLLVAVIPKGKFSSHVSVCQRVKRRMKKVVTMTKGMVSMMSSRTSCVCLFMCLCV